MIQNIMENHYGWVRNVETAEREVKFDKKDKWKDDDLDSLTL